MRVVCLYVLCSVYVGGKELLVLKAIIFTFLHFFDFIQFIYYSKKLYRYLKSKETEIRLFYFDRKAYHEIRLLRIHFKIATILVVIALFFFTVGFSLHYYFWLFSGIIEKIWPDVNHNIIFALRIIKFFHSPIVILYKLLFLLNYLYIVVLIVYKSIRDRKKLANINNSIKPIIKKFHDDYYNGWYRNYS